MLDVLTDHWSEFSSGFWVTVRLVVSDALPGGLAIYGARFGRYPLDPTVALVLRNTPNATR